MARPAPIAARLRDGRAVTLRAAEAADVDAVIALTASVTHERGYTLYEPDELDSAAPRTARRIRDALDNPDELRLIATAQPEGAQHAAVVGDLSLTAGRWRRLAHCATLGIDIRKDYRRLGLGDAMMAAALAWARAHPRIERVELYVYADNAPAIALYTKHGFREEGRRQRYFRLGQGVYADDLIMAVFVKHAQR